MAGSIMALARQDGVAIGRRDVDDSQQAPGARDRACPRCGRPIVRVRRRLIDRLFSLATPVRRYRCYALDCGWVGNLPPRRGADEARDRAH